MSASLLAICRACAPHSWVVRRMLASSTVNLFERRLVYYSSDALRAVVHCRIAILWAVCCLSASFGRCLCGQPHSWVVCCLSASLWAVYSRSRSHVWFFSGVLFVSFIVGGVLYSVAYFWAVYMQAVTVSVVCSSLAAFWAVYHWSARF